MANTLRVLHTTREMWSKKLHDETTRSRMTLAALRKQGKINTNCSGTKLKWTTKYKKLALSGYGDMEKIDWARATLTKTAELPWRAYRMSDAISDMEMKQNKGNPEAVIRLFAEKAKRMQEDAEDQLGGEFYIDGNATANTKRMHGLESFFGITTGSQVATDNFATVYNDSYAGLTTTEGTYGGSSDADEEWNFWTPTVVNVNKTGEAWSSHADEQIRRGILEARKSSKASERIDLICLRKSSFRQLLDILDGKERLTFNRGSKIGLVEFGFTDMVVFDGVDVGFDEDVIAADANSDVVHGYGLNTSKLELCVLEDKLWGASGDVFDETQQAFKFWVGFAGNLKAESPRYHVKFAEVS